MLKDELYFRPPSEADSFIIRVMHGCSYNQCYFCNLFKGIPLKYLPLDEIIAGMEKDAEDISPKFIHHIKSIYFEGGDPLSMPSEKLLKLLQEARQIFPHFKRAVCYATARSIITKKPKELTDLSRAGLRRVFLGLESGSDTVLKRINKGCNHADLVTAGHYLNHAGIENDVSIMLGIGSYELSQEHALETAKLINNIKPICIRIRTYTPNYETPMGNDYLAGRFELMGPHAILNEMKVLADKISCPVQLLSDHWMNFLQFDLLLPAQKNDLAKAIEEALLVPEDKFRTLGITSRRS